MDKIVNLTLDKAREFIVEAIHIDGSHHKQWYLHKLAILLAIPSAEWEDVGEDAIAP